MKSVKRYCQNHLFQNLQQSGTHQKRMVCKPIYYSVVNEGNLDKINSGMNKRLIQLHDFLSFDVKDL